MVHLVSLQSNPNHTLECGDWKREQNCSKEQNSNGPTTNRLGSSDIASFDSPMPEKDPSASFRNGCRQSCLIDKETNPSCGDLCRVFVCFLDPVGLRGDCLLHLPHSPASSGLLLLHEQGHLEAGSKLEFQLDSLVRP